MRKPLALIVEDEAMVMIDLEAALKQAGFAVTAAPSCEKTRQILALVEPDVAILDVLLRDCESDTIAEELVAKEIPFIIYSGTDIEDRSPAFKKGTFVSKPAEVSKLVCLANTLVQR